MSKLRYILFVLFSAITFNVFSCRNPFAELIDNVTFSHPSFKIKMDKSRGDFYVAVLDSTALLSKNDFPNLKNLVDSANHAYDKYLKENRSYYDDSIRAGGRTAVAVFKDSVFASAYYRLYTHVANNCKSVKFSDSNLYKYFADSNPLTWQKSDDGVVLFQDSLYEGEHNSYYSMVRFVVYCPSEDWYYISPLIGGYGEKSLRVPENKGNDWDIRVNTYSKPQIGALGTSIILTLIAVLIVYIISKFGLKIFKLYSPFNFKVVFSLFAIPYAIISFCWFRSLDGGPYDSAIFVVIGTLYLILLLGIVQLIIFCFLKDPAKVTSAESNTNVVAEPPVVKESVTASARFSERNASERNAKIKFPPIPKFIRCLCLVLAVNIALIFAIPFVSYFFGVILLHLHQAIIDFAWFVQS